MNTKTKTKTNLKRALLFFIPLCLIAGMLAVPAFADIESNGINWKEPTGTVSQIEYSVSNGTDTIPVDATGYYVITVSATDLVNCLNVMGELGGFPSQVYLFGTDYESSLDVPNYRGFVNFKWYSEGQYWDNYRYLLVNNMEADNEVVYFYKNNSNIWMVSMPGRSTNVQDYVSNYQYFEFFVPQYPLPDALDINMQQFWNSLDYTVSVVQSSVTPDPEPPAGDDDGGAGDTSGIFDVWTDITDWVINGLKSATNAFYYNGQLTLLGYLCIIPLALGLALLLISIVQKFLHLRG